MNLTVVWALKKAWAPLRGVLEDTPAVLVPLAISIHRDCYTLRQLFLQGPTTPGPPWDPWDVAAMGSSPIPWIIYAYLPSLIF